ncbi:hypothetical protein DTO271D3_2503 [Paecilomyces variotii]|nr:hypothetical protein DTO032I3_2182 [Paecilomyces variotii]KAJ9280798.1 hypothetical protein DTO021D3_2268 [Paecilomyces variotii]KAJ9317213.1 hypothetical protein DTO271D3_2503 [Paecilomyces variotii]KAJ9345194.1 hypothetical protein DTO027B6_2339 [Paecilomyces variotii]KAJ9390338.1 hypothetical protein DTO032I4_1864 [Paecilomyces variotii]
MLGQRRGSASGIEGRSSTGALRYLRQGLTRWPPPRHRSRSQDEVLSGSPRSDLAKTRSFSHQQLNDLDLFEKEREGRSDQFESTDADIHTLDEKSPLLQTLHKDVTLPVHSRLHLIAQRLFDAIAETIKVILSTLAAPGVYAARCFRDDDGHYSPLVPVKKLGRAMSSNSSPPSKGGKPSGHGKGSKRSEKSTRRDPSTRKLRSSTSRDSMVSTTSDSEADRRGDIKTSGGTGRHGKTKAHNAEPAAEDGTPRRSIRIKLHNEDVLKRQKQRRSQSIDSNQDVDNPGNLQAGLAADILKSPTSPSSHKITKYPHSPTPPRPLVPPRQPSYTAGTRGSRIPQKTLVLDLDETLIHSLAKGGRMSSGHMVEVKLATPVTTAVTPGSAPTTLGPQHPILYYVHKRPHCDEFLRKVCKWYKLVIFTASVQEYADPVIDWLEQERKYFHARYYRQHCTLRNGAYIKDLSSVEPDLSKVMILDNSPMSYIFHEDNAIPIEGWINDPTDNGLLHLIPILEALQYVTDVRALLALRRGEAES